MMYLCYHCFYSASRLPLLPDIGFNVVGGDAMFLHAHCAVTFATPHCVKDAANKGVRVKH